jgi:hypothetical protein
MITACSSEGRFCFGSSFRREAGFKRAKSGVSFFRLTPMRVTPNWMARVMAIMAAPRRPSGIIMCFSRSRPSADYFGSAHAGVERVLQERRHAGAQRLDPARTPGAEQPHEDHELQSVDEDAGGGEIAFLAGFFQAPLCGLLGFLLVGHGG